MKRIMLLLLVVPFSVRAMEDEKDWVFISDNFSSKGITLDYNHLLGFIIADLQQGDYHVTIVKTLATNDTRVTVNTLVNSEWHFDVQDAKTSFVPDAKTSSMIATLRDKIAEFEFMLQNQGKK